MLDNAVKLAAESIEIVDHVCHVFEEANSSTSPTLTNTPALHLKKI